MKKLNFAVLILLSMFGQLASAACDSGGAYNSREMAASSFYSNSELTKFSRGSNFPLPNGASARYCASRGCSQQLDVSWTSREIEHLKDLRARMGADQSDQAELRFVRLATLQMEKWLRDRIVRQGTRRMNIAPTGGENAAWIQAALSSYSALDKECVTYTMEASQHLLILSNMGLMRRWNVKPPSYAFGIPGHWTATVQNRQSCQLYRFDLNTRASARESLMASGQNPASLALRDSSLMPGMDSLGRGNHAGNSSLTSLGEMHRPDPRPTPPQYTPPRLRADAPAPKRTDTLRFDSRRFWEEQALSSR